MWASLRLPASTKLSALVIGLLVALVLPLTALGLPNSALHPGAAPGEHLNASVAWSEVVPGEVYSVYTEFAGPGPVGQLIGHSFSAGMGGPGTWINLGPIAPTPPYVSEWNPTISASPLGPYYYAAAAHGSPVWPPYGTPNAIIMNMSMGGGMPFIGPSPTGPIMASIPGVNWVDFPFVRVDDYPMNPGPGMGSAHLAWIEYLEGGDGDPNVDGNMFNDPADVFNIYYTYSNDPGAGTPLAFPAFHPPVLLTPFPTPVFSPSHQMHRPAVEVCGPAGTMAVPPGGVWVAWMDAMGIWLDADAAPAAAAPPPFGLLTGGAGPLLLPTPLPPLPPPFLPGGPPVLASASLALAHDNGPVCPGTLHLVLSGIGPGGDMDIFYMNSPDGGITWPGIFTKVNRDPIGSGADQWAPAISIDQMTGEIRVTYYDRRRAPTVGIETWASSSFDCGVTWTDGLLSDAGPMPVMSTLPPGPIAPGEFYIGDYLASDFQIANNFAHVWNDGRNGMDQDVYFESMIDPDIDGDMWPASVDCNDADPTIYPGAPEVVDDGIDQDCNGFDAVTCVVDGDQDGYGTTLGTPVIAYDGSCDAVQGESNTADDCDDNDNTINPGATEVVDDGIDQDCNGSDAITCYVDGDMDGYGNDAGVPVIAYDGVCNTAQQESASQDDCDDNDNTINPGATEVVDDGIDQDCNGADAITCYVDGDMDGYGNDAGVPVIAYDGVCNTAQQESSSQDDCNDAVASINPGATEIPDDGVDQDCNGADAITCIVDFDQDGYGNDAGVPVIAYDGSCDAAQQESYSMDDCDDNDHLINPGATDIPDDGIDQDCNTFDAVTCYTDGDGDTYGDPTSPVVCALGTCTSCGGMVADNTDCDDSDPGKPPCGCCVGMRGDADGNGSQDISDLTFLVDYFFGGGPAPACFEEADVDASLAIDISDITYIVAWMFSGGPAPLPC